VSNRALLRRALAPTASGSKIVGDEQDEGARRRTYHASHSARGSHGNTNPRNRGRAGDNEQHREAAERHREGAEEDREIAETGRESRDEAATDAEVDRNTAEVQRREAELLRDAREAMRIDAEAIRRASEDARRYAEDARVHAETARQAAETARQMHQSVIEAGVEQRAVAAEMEVTRQHIEAITRSLRDASRGNAD
jgi:hypothetical protein